MKEEMRKALEFDWTDESVWEEYKEKITEIL